MNAQTMMVRCPECGKDNMFRRVAAVAPVCWTCGAELPVEVNSVNNNESNWRLPSRASP
jgi:uncharacterized protein (DUF983 family)